MRKGQEKILQKAEKYGFSQEYITYLRREDLSVRSLECAFSFMEYYKDSGYALSELEPFLSDHVCQDFYYSILHALSYKNKPSPADILSVVHDDAVHESLIGYAIMLFGAGMSITDIHRIFSQYGDLLERGSNYYKLHYVYSDNKNEEDDERAFTFYEILTAPIFNITKKINLPLREKYACLALTDNRINLSRSESTDIEFAIQKNIPPEEYARYNYNPMRYIIGRIPYLDILSEKLLSGENEDFQYEITNFEQLKRLSKITKGEHGLTVTRNPVNAMRLRITPEAINIHLWNYSAAYYDIDAKMWKWDYKSKRAEVKLVVFHDGGIFEERKKLIPLSVKKLNVVRNTYGPYGKTVYSFVIKHSMQVMNAPVLKDIDRLLSNTDLFLPPVSVNECHDMHDMNQLFKKKWKEGYRINWNRINVNLGYAIIKSLPLVPEKDRAKLLEIRNPDLLPYEYIKEYSRIWSRETGYRFISNYVMSRIDTQTPDLYKGMLRDYLQMSHELNQPAKIGFRSTKKIKDAHDKTAKAYNEKKYIHKIKIPKDSKFNELRKLLPKDFEWIKNGKRLYYEGVEMGHCVNSYYDLINRDVCAIYSFIYEEKRYTAEFRRMKDGKYYARQIQSKYDRGCPAKVTGVVHNLLKKSYEV